MRVLFIRHGESEENVTSNTLFNPGGPPPSTEAILKLINETDGPMVDRNLSSLGKQQANILKDFYINPLKQIINNNDDNKIKFVSSIQKRAWSTILPLAKALNKEIYIRDDLHEVGAGPPIPGIRKYAKLIAEKKKDRILVTANELHEIEPRLNTKQYCNQNGSILQDGSLHPGFDPIDTYPEEDLSIGMTGAFLEQVTTRGNNVKQWLQSDELQNEIGSNGLLIIASHAAFLSRLILKSILNCKDWKFNVNLKNSSTTLMSITKTTCDLLTYNNEDHLIKESNGDGRIDSSRLLSRGNKKVRILFVRHGESISNSLLRKYFNGKTKPTETELLQLIHKDKYPVDPPLTSVGVNEMNKFTDYYKQSIQSIINNGIKVKFVASVLNRAWNTILPLATSCNQDIYIRDDLHEISPHGPPMPGMKEFAILWEKEGLDRLHITADELNEHEPRLNTSQYCSNNNGPIFPEGSMTYPLPASVLYPSEGGAMMPKMWDQLLKRCEQVANWLKSKELHEEMSGGGLIIIGCHGGIMATMFNSVFFGRENWQMSMDAQATLVNTSTCLFEITRKNRSFSSSNDGDNGKMMMHHSSDDDDDDATIDVVSYANINHLISSDVNFDLARFLIGSGGHGHAGSNDNNNIKEAKL